MRFNSVRFKISVLYTAILGLILVIYSVFLYLSLHYTLYDELDEELSIKATEIASIISSYLDALGPDEELFDFAVKRAIRFKGEHPYEDKISTMEEQWLRTVDKLDLKEDYVNVIDMATGKIIAASNDLPENLVFVELKAKHSENVIFVNVRYEKRNARVIRIPFSYRGKDVYIIQVATSLKPVIKLLYKRLWHIVFSIPIILIIASFLGRIFSKKILAPVTAITKTASKITHEDLSARVRTEHVDEEMKYLVNAFNDMISRLEKSFKYIAEFSSHVAHELKTPLTIIKGEAEVALRRERSVEEYKRFMTISLEEVERMLRIIEDLLLLTRLDYRPEVFKFEKFDLVELLREASEQAKTLASQKNIGIAIDLPERKINIKGNQLHLRRLFMNLVDNAVKFTPDNGVIDISLTCSAKKAFVSVSDTGIGIPRQEMPKIFDRFYRIERDGQGIEHGSGLGLSISRSIAVIHEGDIRVESELNKGSTFIVTLPLL